MNHTQADEPLNIYSFLFLLVAQIFAGGAITQNSPVSFGGVAGDETSSIEP